MAGSDASEGQAVCQPGGAEEDSRLLKPTYGESCDLNTKFATIGERLQFMRADNAKLRPKLRPKLVKFTPQLEVDYTL